METLISLQKYAAQKHLSLHTIIKKTMSGELPTVVKTENGKEVTYILLSFPDVTESTGAIKEKDTTEKEIIDYEQAYKALHEKYMILKATYEALLQAGGV